MENLVFGIKPSRICMSLGNCKKANKCDREHPEWAVVLNLCGRHFFGQCKFKNRCEMEHIESWDQISEFVHQNPQMWKDHFNFVS